MVQEKCCGSVTLCGLWVIPGQIHNVFVNNIAAGVSTICVQLGTINIYHIK